MPKVHLLSLVVSVYNEEESLNLFWQETEKYLRGLDVDYEVLFVNDGSNDGSLDVLKELSQGDKNIKVINLSRNFGHEAAMIAGIDYSRGDAVICMDADLQHPPSKIGEMVQLCRQGFEVVTAVRTLNEDAGIVKRVTSCLFYRALNVLSAVQFEPNASDFFLISRKVANVIRHGFLERTRFLRGFIQIVGFRRTSVAFTSAKRVAGETKYSLWKLFVFSVTAIVAFSNIPLRLGMLFGTLVGLMSITVGIYSIVMKAMGYVIPGYTTIVVLITFLLAVQFFILGIIGEYIGFIFNESKKRPIYIVDDMINLTGDEQ
ncbi:MAG TPA: glycosyltransferase family 2 protein [Deltaproteobacteria bacterium]|nr:glycosyltransferase family 2 protein [Deltaproteobacteria bacterium]